MRSCALLAADLYIFLVEKIRLDRQTRFFQTESCRWFVYPIFFKPESFRSAAIHLTEDLKGINLNLKKIKLVYAMYMGY